MSWIFLLCAVISEVVATLSLRCVSHGKTALVPVMVVGYVGAFGFLSLTLSHGMPLGVAYGVWIALGVALTAVLSHLLFREPLNRLMGVGIGLIGVGVLLIEVGAAH